MMFRQAPLHVTKSGHVIHGPFPARWGALGTSLACGFLGAMMLLLALQHQRFHCDATGSCTIDDRVAFARSSIKRVDVVIEKGSKNSTYGVVTFTLERGYTWKLMRVDPDDANEARESINASLASGAPVDVELHNPRLFFGIGIGGLACFVVFLVIGFLRMGHFDLIVSPNGQTLDVRRSLFGFPLGARQVPLARVDAVTLERTTISYALRGRYEPETPAARLVLHYRNGTSEPLTRQYFPGNALHYRAAWALRRVLDVDPNAADDAALAKIPMRATSLGNRIGFAWAGVTTGSLVGLLLFGLTMIALKQTHARDNIEGWMFAAGAIPGAIGGAAVVFHATRARLPR